MRTDSVFVALCSALWWTFSVTSGNNPATTRSPLTAFKQLGFNYGGNAVGQQAPYIPYSISTFHKPDDSDPVLRVTL